MRKTTNPLKNTVLKVACQLVAQHGYAGTSVQQIVKAANTTKPSLYYYFGSKAGLFRALVDYAYKERLLLMRQAAAKSESIHTQLIDVGQALLQFADDHPDLMRICFMTAFAPSNEIPFASQYIKHRTRQFEFIHKLIQQGLKRKQLSHRFSSYELTASIFGQFLIQAMVHLIQPPKISPRISAQHIVELFMTGAAPKA